MRTLFALLTALAVTASVQSSPFISDNFARTGPSETVVAPFTAGNGTSTVNNYSNFVEIIVTGTGNSLGQFVNDAFYGVPFGTLFDSQFYQMNIGLTGNPFVPHAGEDNNISQFIVFDDGVGPVTPEYYPAFNATNTYRFVINVGALLGPLSFGVSDGDYLDNGGEYTVQVFQVEPATVPEPISLVVFGGLVVGGGLVARKRLMKKVVA